MVGRVKFQVWGKHGWCTAYVKSEMLFKNIKLFSQYDIKVKVGDLMARQAA